MVHPTSPRSSDPWALYSDSVPQRCPISGHKNLIKQDAFTVIVHDDNNAQPTQSPNSSVRLRQVPFRRIWATQLPADGRGVLGDIFIEIFSQKPGTHSPMFFRTESAWRPFRMPFYGPLHMFNEDMLCQHPTEPGRYLWVLTSGQIGWFAKGAISDDRIRFSSKQADELEARIRLALTLDGESTAEGPPVSRAPAFVDLGDDSQRHRRARKQSTTAKSVTDGSNASSDDSSDELSASSYTGTPPPNIQKLSRKRKHSPTTPTRANKVKKLTEARKGRSLGQAHPPPAGGRKSEPARLSRSLVQPPTARDKPAHENGSTPANSAPKKKVDFKPPSAVSNGKKATPSSEILENAVRAAAAEQNGAAAPAPAAASASAPVKPAQPVDVPSEPAKQSPVSPLSSTDGASSSLPMDTDADSPGSSVEQARMEALRSRSSSPMETSPTPTPEREIASTSTSATEPTKEKPVGGADQPPRMIPPPQPLPALQSHPPLPPVAESLRAAAAALAGKQGTAPAVNGNGKGPNANTERPIVQVEVRSVAGRASPTDGKSAASASDTQTASGASGASTSNGNGKHTSPSPPSTSTSTGEGAAKEPDTSGPVHHAIRQRYSSTVNADGAKRGLKTSSMTNSTNTLGAAAEGKQPVALVTNTNTSGPVAPPTPVATPTLPEGQGAAGGPSSEKPGAASLALDTRTPGKGTFALNVPGVGPTELHSAGIMALEQLLSSVMLPKHAELEAKEEELQVHAQARAEAECEIGEANRRIAEAQKEKEELRGKLKAEEGEKADQVRAKEDALRLVEDTKAKMDQKQAEFEKQEQNMREQLFAERQKRLASENARTDLKLRLDQTNADLESAREQLEKERKKLEQMIENVRKVLS